MFTFVLSVGFLSSSVFTQKPPVKSSGSAVEDTACCSDSESSYQFRNKTKWETQGSSLDQHLKIRSMAEQWFCSKAGRGRGGFQGQCFWLLLSFQIGRVETVLTCTVQTSETCTRVRLCWISQCIHRNGSTPRNLQLRADHSKQTGLINLVGKDRQWKGSCASWRVETRGWGTGGTHRVVAFLQQSWFYLHVFCSGCIASRVCFCLSALYWR